MFDGGSATGLGEPEDTLAKPHTKEGPMRSHQPPEPIPLCDPAPGFNWELR